MPVPVVDQPPHAPPAVNHGGDSAGLICGYLLMGGAAPQAADSVQAAHWLAG
ncbi:MAG: hypothetical protein K2Q97_04645 [Burkholderiaceae bacterium]|nr:hypothetical protein [Burkholderiaceae bacterium]